MTETNTDTEATIRICKNETCGNIVPPPRKHAHERLFCSYQCGTRHHRKMYYERETGRGGVAKTSTGVRVLRRKLPTAKAAEARYKKHHQSCPLAAGGTCPAASDAYGLDRECLMKAVFLEDWNELRRHENGMEAYTRYLTTDDGEWLPQSETRRIRGIW